MSFTYRIDAEQGLMFLTAEGEVTQAERVETMRAWMADPKFRPGLNTLFDVSQSTSTPSLNELKELIGLVARQSAAIGKIKLAIFASRAITFGVARQFATLADPGPLEVQVFGSRDDALAWLHKDTRKSE